MKYDVNMIGIDSPDRNMLDEITLAGAVRKYWHVISIKWEAERTISENIQDYQKRIFQCSDKLKPLSAYTSEDFDVIVDILSERKEYKEGTRKHYKHLLQVVIDACIDNGEKMHPSVTRELLVRKDITNTKLIKSFTAEECSHLYDWVKDIDAAKATGPEIAVAIMFFLGLRNQEAAGLLFSSVFYDERLDIDMCRITHTVKGKKPKSKLKGKTPNAHRELPIYCTILTNLIRERRRFVLEATASKDISMIPICCGKDYHQPCSYDDITQCAYQVFKKLSIYGSTWESFGIEHDELEVVKAEEKDPTAYALRRNAATRYYGLDLTEAELHYVMGHAIEVTGIQRSDYMNSELMIPIVTKLKSHSYYLEGKNETKK